MSVRLNQGTMMKTLDWTYDKAIEGIIGLESAQEIADSYLSEV